MDNTSRFAFGRNWQTFFPLLVEERIAAAQRPAPRESP